MTRSTYKAALDHVRVIMGSGAARAVALLNNIIIARFLGPEGYGRFSLFYVVMIIAWLIPQAFDTTFIRYAKAAHDIDQRDKIFKSAFQLKTLYFLIVLIAAYPLSLLLGRQVFKQDNIEWLLVAALITGSLLCFMNTVISTFQENEKFGRYAILQGLNAFLVLGGIGIVFWVLNLKSVDAVVQVYLLVSIAIGGISIWIVTRTLRDLASWDKNTCIGLIRFGKWIFATACVFFIYSRIDTMFLARMVAFEQVGHYSAAVQVAMIVSIISGAMSVVFLPRSIGAVKSRKSLINYIKDAIIPITLMNLAIVVLMFLAPLIVTLLFGKAYMAAVLPLRILLVSYIIFSFYQPLSFLFYAMDVPQTRFALETVKLIMAFFFLYYLVPKWNLAGAAFALTMAMTLYTVLSIIVLWLQLGRYFKQKEVQKNGDSHKSMQGSFP